jgi:hypothetical protein
MHMDVRMPWMHGAASLRTHPDPTAKRDERSARSRATAMDGGVRSVLKGDEVFLRA